LSDIIKLKIPLGKFIHTREPPAGVGGGGGGGKHRGRRGMQQGVAKIDHCDEKPQCLIWFDFFKSEMDSVSWPFLRNFSDLNL